MVETLMDAPCPICGRKSLIYRAEELDLPYFGKCLQTTIICKNCGFRHADVMMLEVHEPMEYKVKIKEEKDLYIKVVRSTSGTLMIPEIDAKLEPGPLSEAFITNVEGVLNRFVDILVQLMHDTPEKKDDVLNILRKIGYIKHGRMEATLIIQDPLGNSAIISEKTEKRKLTEEEVKNLKLGEFVIDIKDLR